ncbi:uncharacterized protein BYT42DRAFT_161312 [Radiomyces spectabilis]|uniref:uncharacterized protein n=1 Tax=Radiomyces spectabilis TaxID=64574 RepID=UPI00221E58F8|nr:uncharacterized protein BYT42DRAFT_161312 [Radiomyces spectabilis]KAI8365360.1 hypothetical protein BYT42DRAFT_161312 [Radiomyces spectabilis]
MSNDESILDIGQRPSRQRRHLPMAVDTLKKSTSTPSRRVNGQRLSLFRMTYRDSASPVGRDIAPPIVDDNDNLDSQVISSARARTKSLRRRHGSSRVPDRSYPGSSSPRWSPKFNPRWWIWLGCIAWGLFLLIRIGVSYSEANYHQLSIVQFLLNTWGRLFNM